MTPSGRSYRRRRGHALLGTVVFLILIMFIWGVTLARLGSYTRVAKANLERGDRATGQTRALASGLALLESGLPPADPYACRMAPDSANPTRVFVLTFQEIAPWQFSVVVRPAGMDDGGLPEAPTTFSTSSGNGRHPIGDVPPPYVPPAPPPSP
jgi:hypothetical protein